MAIFDHHIQKEIVEQAKRILDSREEAGFEAAAKLWRELDSTCAEYRTQMPAEIFDLIMQLEFLFEDDPMAELSEARRTLYLAEVYVPRQGGS